MENWFWFAFLKEENNVISGKFTYNLDLQNLLPFHSIKSIFFKGREKTKHKYPGY
jgi:hypothetical protein